MLRGADHREVRGQAHGRGLGRLLLALLGQRVGVPLIRILPKPQKI